MIPIVVDPPTGVRQWVYQRMGPTATMIAASNPDGEADVWRIELNRTPIAYLKRHRIQAKWRREHTMIRWLRRPPAAPVPELLDADAHQRLLLLSVCPGTLVGQRSWSSDEQLALYAQAGHFRRRMDDVPIDDDDPIGLPDALALRHRTWCQKAQEHLEPPLMHQIECGFDPKIFGGLKRRWCHRDFTPHNWLASLGPLGPRLSVIDFGQSRPDAWLVDIVPLVSQVGLEPTLCSAAFWEGYGRRPTDAEHAQLRHLTVLHGLATTTWGARHGQASVVWAGRAILQRAFDCRLWDH